MAILSKIRDRSGFLILIIGLAMLSFVVSPKDIIDFFSNKNSDVVGTVNGQEILYTEYATRVENARQQAGNRKYGPLYFENLVWNQMVNEKLYEEKLEEAGIVVGQAEIWNAIVNNNNIKNAPQFKNEQGVFSEAMVKEYINNLQSEKTTANKASLDAWLNFEQSVKKNLLTQTYNDLISNGISISKEEAKQNYINQNTKVGGQLVYLPYSTIPNADVKVTQDEVETYVNENENQYQTKATRDIDVVKFSFIASPEDELEIKKELATLIDDKKEYNKITKSTELVKGFVNTTNEKEFISEVGSDLPVDIAYLKESALTGVIKEDVKNSKIGNIVGPYKFSNYYKLSKVVAIKQLPDSVQASHILINHIGAQSAQNATRTEEQAKVLADSLLSVVKTSINKFASLAENYSTDPGSASNKGDLGWFTYTSMVPNFRDFCFESKKGDLGIVKTNFGYHIINIVAQKNFETAYKLATISRKIEASETTENAIFEKAEIFANKIKEGEDFKALAKENNYTVLNAKDLKEMDTYAGPLGQNRSVVKWSFNEDTDLKDSKRFDLDEKGYAVVILTNKQQEGLISATKAYKNVEPILLREKKAALLKEKMSGTSLNDIATTNKVTVENFNGVSLNSTVISGIGKEPAVAGAAVHAQQGTIINNIIGEKGVFAFQVNTTEKPETKEITDAELKVEIDNLKNTVARNIGIALRENAEIQDFRSDRY